jgi:hypothetical protein
MSSHRLGRRDVASVQRLRAAGFRPRETGEDEQISELWYRDGCQARLNGPNGAIEVRWPSGSEWVSVNEELSVLMTLAGRVRDHGDTLYLKLRPWAHTVKTVLQMLTGLGAAVAILWAVIGTGAFPNVASSTDRIAAALAVSAAIELAYTLFTPGPDEVIDPLMLGISSGLLIISSKLHDAPVPLGAALLFGVVGLGGLFVLRRRFIDHHE